MATNPKKRSFVVSYEEDGDKLTVCSLYDADIAPFLARALKVDWPLASMNHELNDDIAQRLGATALSILALHNPVLKPLLNVTLEVPKPSDGD